MLHLHDPILQALIGSGNPLPLPNVIMVDAPPSTADDLIFNDLLNPLPEYGFDFLGFYLSNQTFALDGLNTISMRNLYRRKVNKLMEAQKSVCNRNEYMDKNSIRLFLSNDGISNILTLRATDKTTGEEVAFNFDDYILVSRPKEVPMDYDIDSRPVISKIIRSLSGEEINKTGDYAISLNDFLDFIDFRHNNSDRELSFIHKQDFYAYSMANTELNYYSTECTQGDLIIRDVNDDSDSLNFPLITSLNGNSITLEGTIANLDNVDNQLIGYEIISNSNGTVLSNLTTRFVSDIRVANSNNFRIENIQSGFDHRIRFYQYIDNLEERILFEKNISIPQIQQDVITKRISMINDSPFKVTQLQYHKIEAELDSGEKVIEEGCSRVSSQQSLDIVPIFKQYVVEFQENNGQLLNASRITLNNFVYTGVKSLNETLGSINLQWYADGNLIDSETLPSEYTLFYRFYPAGEVNDSELVPYSATPPNPSVSECVL